MDKIFFSKEHIYKRDLKEEDYSPKEWDIYQRCLTCFHYMILQTTMEADFEQDTWDSIVRFLQKYTDLVESDEPL
jgi:hypothetical protein